MEKDGKKIESFGDLVKSGVEISAICEQDGNIYTSPNLMQWLVMMADGFVLFEVEPHSMAIVKGWRHRNRKDIKKVYEGDVILTGRQYLNIMIGKGGAQ